jgi:hypothetical protein
MAHDPHPPVDPPAAPASDRFRGLPGKLRLLFFAVLGGLVALNIFITPHHPHFGLEKVPGFWALFGLGVAVLLGKAAKGAAHTFLGKDEDYYENQN